MMKQTFILRCGGKRPLKTRKLKRETRDQNRTSKACQKLKQPTEGDDCERCLGAMPLPPSHLLGRQSIVLHERVQIVGRRRQPHLNEWRRRAAAKGAWGATTRTRITSAQTPLTDFAICMSIRVSVTSFNQPTHTHTHRDRGDVRVLYKQRHPSNANTKTQAIGKFIQLLAIQLNPSLALCALHLNMYISTYTWK